MDNFDTENYTTSKYHENPSNFNKVKEFHTVFEHDIKQVRQSDIFDKNPKMVQLRLNLIKEELSELEEAIEKKDMTGVADALLDILYVTYGAGHVFGLNLDEGFDIVHKSNMTKACTTIDEAEASILNIKENFPVYKNPKYKLSSDGKYYIIYDENTGKILKSKYYTEAKLDNF